MSYPGKRIFDVVAVLVTAPLWLPLFLLVALLVGLRMGRPVFFAQPRVGLDEKSFQMWKFRTMLNSCGADGQPLPDAERITPFGRWLRSTSLDELPELLCVLSGSMSLVGPRPLLLKYLPRYSAVHRRRHLVRPGLTGLAQVSGRSKLSWPERFDLDVHYVDNCSLALDLRILLMTVLAVIRRRDVVTPEGMTSPEFLGYGE